MIIWDDYVLDSQRQRTKEKLRCDTLEDQCKLANRLHDNLNLDLLPDSPKLRNKDWEKRT